MLHSDTLEQQLNPIILHDHERELANLFLSSFLWCCGGLKSILGYATELVLIS